MDSPAVKQRLSLVKILSLALNILRKNRRSVILIYLVCFFLPFIGHELFFSLQGKNLLSVLPHIDLEFSLIPTLTSFFMPYIFSYLGIIYVSLVGYGALVILVARFLTTAGDSHLSPKELLLASLRLSPRLILAVFSLIFLGLLAIVIGVSVPIFLPLTLISIALGIALGTMIPALLVMAPHHSTLATIHHALTLKYCPYRRWSVFFILLVVPSLEVSIISALTALSEPFLNMSQPFSIWSMPFLDIFPFSPMWLIQFCLLTATTALFSVFPAILSVIIYNRCQTTE